MIFADVFTEYVIFVQYSHDLAVSANFDSTPGYEVNSGEYVAFVNERVVGRYVRRVELQREHAHASVGRVLKRRTIFQQLPIQVKTNVGLQRLGKRLEYHVHVDAVRVGPRMLERLLHTFGQLFGYVVKFNEVFHALLHFFQLFRALVHFHDNRCHITKYSRRY